MEILYEREGGKTYAVLSWEKVEIEAGKEEVGKMTGSDYQVQMIEKNQIPGLLPCYITYENGQPRFHYDVTGKTSMKELFGKGMLRSTQLLCFHQTLLELMMNLDRFLLCMQRIVLLENVIFFDKKTMQPYFCYYPDEQHDLEDDVKSIYKNFMGLVDYADQRAVEMVYQLEALAMNQNYTADTIREVLKNKTQQHSQNGMEGKTIVQETEKETAFNQHQDMIRGLFDDEEEENESKKKLREKLLAVWKQSKEKIINLVMQKLPKRFASRISNKCKKKELQSTVCPSQENMFELPKQREDRKISGQKEQCRQDEEDEMFTRRLGSEEELTCFRLIGMDGRPEQIRICNLPSVLGTHKEMADVCVGDDTVSRVHAKFSNANGTFQIEDLNSTNGTLLNGEDLLPYTPKTLKNGDILTFGGAKYRIDNMRQTI